VFLVDSSPICFDDQTISPECSPTHLWIEHFLQPHMFQNSIKQTFLVALQDWGQVSSLLTRRARVGAVREAVSERDRAGAREKACFTICSPRCYKSQTTKTIDAIRTNSTKLLNFHNCICFNSRSWFYLIHKIYITSDTKKLLQSINVFTILLLTVDIDIMISFFVYIKISNSVEKLQSYYP